ncbi:MAG: hypothetical protein MJ211_03605 [Bacteroidales bacterium]|nr:hypothetical protein [Bacteroidales bacterium]
MNYEYKNIMQLEGLITNTYILSVVVALIFVGIAFLISSLIAYEGGKYPKDAKRRRIWFVLIGIVSAIAFFCYNFLYVGGKIVPTAMLQDKFFIHTAIASGVTLVTYFLVGFGLSKLFKRTKFGTIFPSK